VSTAEAPWSVPALAVPRVESRRRDTDGALILRSAVPLDPYPRCLGDLLVAGAHAHGPRVFLGERRAGPQSPWRELTWADALTAVESLGQALLDLGAGPQRPLILLSGNSVAHALLTLAAMHVGVPAAPISVAYSLQSTDFAKLERIVRTLTPGVVYADRLAPFAAAIEAAGLAALPVIHGGPAEPDEPDEGPHEPGVAPSQRHLFSALLQTVPSPAVSEAFTALSPDTVAKILFTSGSTGQPKGVVNTHRMLCSNQAALSQLWPFLAQGAAAGQPPQICDWLPWNHTFGANFNFNMVLMHGGTLWIDGGKPAPGLFDTTLINLRDRPPSLYFNVPRGFELLIHALERDGDLRDRFFSKLELIFYAGAALPQNLWRRLEALALASRGQRVLMVSAWGSTETAPCATVVHWPIERAGVIGNPVPGTEVALVPNEDKLELRVRGPNVTPGYWRAPTLSAAAFDEHGFYRIGDAGYLADPQQPERGIIFDGRVAEDFKLSSGTWVHVGKLTLEAIAALEPLISDCVVAGHDRGELGLLLFPNLAACRAVAGVDTDTSPVMVLTSAPVRAAVAVALAAHNRKNPGTSVRFSRAQILVEPPSIDDNEITDKGYINQRAVLNRRSADVEALFCGADGVIFPSESTAIR